MKFIELTSAGSSQLPVYVNVEVITSLWRDVSGGTQVDMGARTTRVTEEPLDIFEMMTTCGVGAELYVKPADACPVPPSSSVADATERLTAGVLKNLNALSDAIHNAIETIEDENA